MGLQFRKKHFIFLQLAQVNWDLCTIAQGWYSTFTAQKSVAALGHTHPVSRAP